MSLISKCENYDKEWWKNSDGNVKNRCKEIQIIFKINV